MIQLLLILAAILSIVLATIVLLNNHKKRINLIYACFASVGALWLLSNAITIAEGLNFFTPSDTLFELAARLITPTSLIATFFLFLYARAFINSSFPTPKLVTIFAVPTVLVSAFSFTSINLTYDNGEVIFGPLYPFYLATLIFNASLTLIVVFRSSKKYSHQKINQVNYLRYSLLISILPIIILGATPVSVVGTNAQNLAPLFSLVFIILAGMAIFKHKL